MINHNDVRDYLLQNFRVLKLTLSKQPFEVMFISEKKNEYRNPSKWILSRLLNKDGSRKKYDYIMFVNGYGSTKPYFFCDYNGWGLIQDNQNDIIYSNGLRVKVVAKDVIIFCGNVATFGNTESLINYHSLYKQLTKKTI